MSSARDPVAESELTVDEAIRALLLLMPRLVGRAKRIPVPEVLQPLALTPRHLTLLSLLLFDGPMTVNALAARLEVAPTTVSLLISELSRKGIVERHEDDTDRRRRIVGLAGPTRQVIEEWLARGARAWRTALTPLTPHQRRIVVATLQLFEQELAGERWPRT